MLSDDAKRGLQALAEKMTVFTTKRRPEYEIDSLSMYRAVNANDFKIVFGSEIAIGYPTLGGDIHLSNRAKIESGLKLVLPIRHGFTSSKQALDPYFDIERGSLIKTLILHNRPPKRSRKDHETKFHKFYESSRHPKVDNPLLTKLMSRIVDKPMSSNTTLSKETFPYELFLSPTVMRQTGKSTLAYELLIDFCKSLS